MLASDDEQSSCPVPNSAFDTLEPQPWRVEFVVCRQIVGVVPDQTRRFEIADGDDVLEEVLSAFVLASLEAETE